jgi:2-polyprenyl-3-methyl-5-hydroxy-6-metoxy-1,4-benzoquinol methylase
MQASTKGPNRLHWTKQLVQRFWDGVAQTRLIELSFSKLGGPALIAAISHLLPPEGRILDFGAGDGHLVKLMCERGLHVAAYEPSGKRSENLRQMVSTYPNFLGVENENSVQSFDVVIMAEVIEHVLDEDLDQTLSLLRSLTKKDGLLILTTPNNEDLDLSMCYCPLSNSLFHRWQHVRSFTRDSLLNLLGRFNFQEVVTHRVDFEDKWFVPYDSFGGATTHVTEVPDYMQKIRANRHVALGGGNNLLHVGRRVA